MKKVLKLIGTVLAISTAIHYVITGITRLVVSKIKYENIILQLLGPFAITWWMFLPLIINPATWIIIGIENLTEFIRRRNRDKLKAVEAIG